MMSRLFQTTKAICYVVTFALLLQPGGIGCALGCTTKAASVTDQQECHTSTSNSATEAHVAATAFSAEHACCHSSVDARREAVKAKLVKTSHQVAGMMLCCMLAGQIATTAVKQRATVEKASALAREKVSTLLNKRFEVVPLVGHARLPDRGETYLSCRALLI